MKIRIPLIISFCLTVLYCAGQVCPDILNNTTDPNNPQHYLGNDPEQNHYINLRTNGQPKCDWMENNFLWWAPGTQNNPPDNCLFENPFWTLSNNDNLNGLFNSNPLLRDNRPEDGWELVVFNFGIRIDTDQITTVSHPYLVLYNKHRGILRVFYYLAEPNFNEDYDLVTFRLDFDEDGTEDKESANLNHMEEVARPIDLYRKYQNEERANQLNNGLAPNQNHNWCTAMWIYADFVMAYDPCVCKYNYDKFKISVRNTTEANLTLTGDLTTNEATKNSPGTGQANTTSNYKAAYKNVVGSAKEAKTYYKSGKEWVGFATGIVGKIPEKKEDEIEKYLKLASGVPYLGAAIGVVNFFLFQEEKEEKPETQAVSFNATVNITGTITSNATPESIKIHVPGSDYGITNSSTLPNEVPLYDEPLGVVSLLNTPEITFQSITPQTPPNQPQIWNHNLPIVTEYKVSEPLELVVNPSSELELIDAKASIVLTYSTGAEKDFENPLDPNQFLHYPYIPGATFSFAGMLNSAGWSMGNIGTYQDNDWQLLSNSNANLELFVANEFYKVSYGQSPVSCFANKSFHLLSEEPASSGNLPKIVIRLNITMKNPNTEIYFKFVQSYDVASSKFIEIPSQGFNYHVDPNIEPIEGKKQQIFDAPLTLLPFIGSGPFNSYGSGFFQDFRFFENETISGFIDAGEGIVIGDNVTIQPGTVITAGKYITVSPENTFSPEVKLQIGIRDQSCLEDPNTRVVTDYAILDDWCKQIHNGGKYNPNVTRNKTIPEKDTTPIVKSFDFKLYPNPTRNAVNVELPEMAEGGVYDITVMDIRGQVMSEMRILPSETIGSVYEMEVSHLTAGIYFVRLVIDGEAKVKRLVIL